MKITSLLQSALAAVLVLSGSFVFSQGFYDGFETGSYTPNWTITGGSCTYTVPSGSAPVGSYHLEQTGTGTHLQGLRATFSPDQIMEVSYYVKSSDITSSGAYVILTPSGGASASDAISFMYISSAGNIRFYTDGSNNINVPCTVDTWYFIELKNFDWTGKTFDIYVNGALQSSAFPFRNPSATEMSEIHLYNLSTSITSSYDEFNVVPSCGTTGATAVAAAGPLDFYLDSTGSVTLDPLDVDGGSYVECYTMTLALSDSTFTCANTVDSTTLYAMDYFGNIDSTTVQFNLLDTIAPTASNIQSMVSCIADVPAPDSTVITDAMDNCSASVNWVSDVSDGLSCPETITRTYSVTDPSGNSIFATHTIIVQDTVAPMPDSLSLPEIQDVCPVTPPTPTGTDNCSASLNVTADVAFPITAMGTTTITWTFEDDCGNTSTLTQDVTISQMDVSTSLNGITISANQSGATYQWIDCSNNAAVSGATSQDFTPSANGDYAVIIDNGSCSDTSACVTVSEVSLTEIYNAKVLIYPNPSAGEVMTIKTSETLHSVQVLDMTGREVEVEINLNAGTLDARHLASGHYTVVVTTEESGSFTKTIVIGTK